MRLDREPCPWRILDDVGGAWSTGAVGGSIWFALKGARNAARGETFGHTSSLMLRNSLEMVRMRAPVVGGSFATWGFSFAFFECGISALRRQEDPWNSILSGGATGALLAIRAGPKAAAQHGMVGMFLLAAIEGLNIVLTRQFAPPILTAEEYQKQGEYDPLQPPVPASPFGMPDFGFGSSSSSKEEDSSSSDISNTYETGSSDTQNFGVNDMPSDAFAAPSSSSTSDAGDKPWWKAW